MRHEGLSRRDDAGRASNITTVRSLVTDPTHHRAAGCWLLSWVHDGYEPYEKETHTASISVHDEALSMVYVDS
jgi:hypothetical protein